ncbi:MAG: tetratricopeptide repeat protein [Rhodanobacteraceae bacterium]
MAFEDYDDYEKSEHVVQWLRDNAWAIVSGIVLGLLLIFGVNQWRTHQATHRAGAAAQYQLMTDAIQAGNKNAIDAAASTLKDEYKDTPFAVFASLQQGELAVKNGSPAEAEMPLKWAREHAGDPALKALAELRLARVQLAAGSPQAAIGTIDALPKGSFAGPAAELRGDALLALKRQDEARKAYQAALDGYDEGAAPRRLVQLKLDNLAQAGKQGS